MANIGIKKSVWLAVAAAVIGLAPMSHADTLAPGGSTSTFAPTPPSDALGSLVASTSGAFSSGSWSGIFTEFVYSIAGGREGFVFQITSNSSSAQPFDEIALSNWGHLGTDVFVFGSGIRPDFAHRTADGNTIDFNFTGLGGNGVAPGQSTVDLVVAVNSTQIVPGTISFIDGNTDTEVILSPVPEPGSLMLFGSGLSGLAMMLRRRKKAIPVLG